ncbi:hypothetical protein [Nocardia bovistercoris]|uniref:Uncharacterized protein n=1 Tax=Nocardia bovistercoris TaxID=2785916 RepID=A0A931IEA7_9NOCA|nr:hypothetical protein [Nocardia bovistercoris]MBH0779889.1 hypothetical protein [Nocardia bovistercoris]
MSIDRTVPAEHGIPLTARVIEVVRRDPTASALDYWNVPWGGERPFPVAPEALAGMTFPSGRPLSPSLRTWLAYDTDLLRRHGWFTAEGAFAPRSLDAIVAAEFGEGWGTEFEPLAGRFPECFLLPGGSDSRRVLAVGEPDAVGEYPVLALDLDDMPYVGLMYPGFDVYLADTAGLVEFDFHTYTALAAHPAHADRMREHAAHFFGGDVCAEWPFGP